MEKVFHEKGPEEKILPEYFFHLEQIFLGTNIHWHKQLVSHVHLLICCCASIKVKNVIIILYFVSFIVDKHLIEQLRDHLKKNEKKIKDKLKRYPEVLLKITDDFIECDILDIDTVEKILYDDSLKEVPQRLVELVIANIHLGAYNRLLETLKSEKNLKGLVFQLTTAGHGQDIKTGTLYYYKYIVVIYLI